MMMLMMNSIRFYFPYDKSVCFKLKNNELNKNCVFNALKKQYKDMPITIYIKKHVYLISNSCL